ncbi:unnamed protein product [Camellia sinensis]
MNLMNSQNQKHQSSKHNKKRLTQDQVRLLETSFSSSKKLEPERKLRLAQELGIPPRQIAIWYQNKRARWKAQKLELDYGTLQLRLGTALAEKRRLEKEVERLGRELEEAHMVLLSLKQPPPKSSPPLPPPPPPPPPVSCLSSCSSLHEGHVSCCCWVNNEALQLEELYACLTGADGSNCA